MIVIHRYNFDTIFSRRDMAESPLHSRVIVILVLCLLILPIALPLVGASSEWKEDGWLDADWFTKDGRIASGDELGCQGMLSLIHI